MTKATRVYTLQTAGDELRPRKGILHEALIGVGEGTARHKEVNVNRDQGDAVRIGWATEDVTPDRPVNLAGQFCLRISKGVHDPVTVTAMALSAAGPEGDSIIWVSCDRPSLRDNDQMTFLSRCREAVLARTSEIDVKKIVLNATHTHSAPDSNSKQYERVPDGVMTPEEYMELLLHGITEAVLGAWSNRRPGGVSWGLGTAVVGHNRRATYFEERSGERRPGIIANGFTKMYGDTNDPQFSHIEGYEDHYVDLLYTWDAEENLTGVVVNIASPSQETEGNQHVSADFWHEIRTEIRERHGKHIQILAQCSAAGDQSPHRLWYKRAEQRMLDLRGLTMREEIGRRVAHAVADVLPVARKTIETSPALKHIVRTIHLPRRIITDEEAEQVRTELAELEAGDRGKNTYAAMRRCRRALKRYESQKECPAIPMELHVVRIGDVAFATNRFELFLDFGTQIKARSPAVQTFVVQLAADDIGSGTYLPTERALASKGYGGGVYDNEVGPDGGRLIVEETVKTLNELWEK